MSLEAEEVRLRIPLKEQQLSPHFRMPWAKKVSDETVSSDYPGRRRVMAVRKKVAAMET